MENPSPFDGFQKLDGLTEEQRKAQVAKVQEECTRYRRVFEENPEGAAILASWRKQLTEPLRGATAREPYTLGYMDGQGDMVRLIDRLIRMAKEGV